MTLKKKNNSYRKLKEKYEKEIQELRNDIYNLVNDKDFNAEMQVRMKWKLRFATDEQVWMGETSEFLNKVYFDGILNRLQNEDKTKEV